MPVPAPQPGESQTDFMSRCMSDADMLDEFDEDDTELAAACNLAWDEAQSDDDVGTAQLRLRQTAAPPPNGNPFEFVMSDGSIDRVGDIIDPDGWLLDNFRRNPIALFGHNPGFPIGKWDDVRVRKGELVGRLDLMDPVSDRLREVHAAVSANVLRAVSVGFRGIDFEPINPKEPWGGLRFMKSELVECSLVSVPANPNALAIAKGLGLSRETQSLIFGVTADERGAKRRGLPGVSAVIPPIRKKHTMTAVPIGERIEIAQTSLVALQDRLREHYDSHPTLDDDALNLANEVIAQIDAQQRALDTLRRSEQSIAGTSEIIVPSRAVVPVREQSTAIAPRPFAMPKREEKPGHLLLNAIIAHTKADRFRLPTEKVLADYGWAEDLGVRTCLEWIQRAATAPATSNTATWAQELVQTQYAELLSALLIKSVYGPLVGYGVRYTLGRFGQISIPVEQITPTIAGSFVAEGAPIPVRQGAFTSIQIGLKKMAVITSFTRELLEHSVPNIDTQLRDMISRHTAVAIDTVLLDNNAATAVRPAGLRAGVTGQTPTAGGGFAALVADLKNLLGVLVAANSLRSPVWIMNPQQALSISLTQSSAGVGVFPFKAEIEAGMLLRYPVIESPTVPLTEVILVDAADYASLTGDDARFELSDQATLHMEDTTPLAIGTPGTPNTVAAPVRSMFQTDSIALRMIMPMNWIMRRAGLVAWVTGVTW
jgi:HK97 family phage major capsid protein/HK97 family phage prohead protease